MTFERVDEILLETSTLTAPQPTRNEWPGLTHFLTVPLAGRTHPVRFSIVHVRHAGIPGAQLHAHGAAVFCASKRVRGESQTN